MTTVVRVMGKISKGGIGARLKAKTGGSNKGLAHARVPGEGDTYLRLETHWKWLACFGTLNFSTTTL
jgi:hypothetical protein